jgi:hypothetical protein
VNLELTDEETRALLNLLVETIGRFRQGRRAARENRLRHLQLLDRLFDQGFDTL